MPVRSFFTRRQVRRARRSQRSQRARITPRQSRMAHRHTLKKKGGKRSGRKSRKSRKVYGGGIGETHQEVEGIPVGDEVVVASPSGVRSLSEFMAHQDREETEDI